jgi:hypothetical protein
VLSGAYLEVKNWLSCLNELIALILSFAASAFLMKNIDEDKVFGVEGDRSAPDLATG